MSKTGRGRDDPDYKWAIHRREWTEARRTAIIRAGYRCQMCLSPRLEGWMPTEAVQQWVEADISRMHQGAPMAEGTARDSGAQVHHVQKIYRRTGESRQSFLLRFCDPSNLQCLCPDCHKEVHAADHTSDVLRANTHRLTNQLTLDAYGEEVVVEEHETNPYINRQMRKKRN